MVDINFLKGKLWPVKNIHKIIDDLGVPVYKRGGNTYIEYAFARLVADHLGKGFSLDIDNDIREKMRMVFV